MSAPAPPRSEAANAPVVDCLRGPSALAAMGALAPVWGELCDRAGLSPFMRPEWVRAHLRAFERADALRLLVVRRGGARTGGARSGDVCAILPLVADRTWFRGLRVRRLRAAANHHTLRFDLVCDPDGREEIAGAIWKFLAESRRKSDRPRGRPEWDLLELRDVPAGGAAEALLEAAARDGCATGRWRSPIESRPIALETQSGAAAFTCDASRWSASGWTSMGGRGCPLRSGHLRAASTGSLPPGLQHTTPKFRRELRRTRRRLESSGRLAFEAVESPSRAQLDEFFALEAAGWKGGAGGNAVLRKPPNVAAFYRELAVAAAARGRFLLHRLTWNGAPIALSYTLLGDGVCIPLRWCYDERWSACGPGHLLIESILGEGARRGLQRFAFIGEAFRYERKWSPAGEPGWFLYIFPPGWRGRLLHRMKFLGRR